MLVTSIFFFSHNVFVRLLHACHISFYGQRLSYITFEYIVRKGENTGYPLFFFFFLFPRCLYCIKDNLNLLTTLKKKPFDKMGNEENVIEKHFLLPSIVSTLPKTNSKVCVTFVLPSEKINAFNLDKPRTCSLIKNYVLSFTSYRQAVS